MASEKEITSTEKLLDVIRGAEKQESGAADEVKARESRESLLTGRFARQKGVTVGIDIGYSRIRFVTVSQSSHKRWKLLDYASSAIPADIEKGTPAFTAFLKESLAKYCGPPGKVDLWAMMSAANVEVRNFTVPVVAKKELENVVFWSAKKELDFSESESVFDYEVQGKIVESGIEKLGILFYTVPRKNVEDTRGLFAAAGYPLAGLTIAPMALQNIFRTDWVPAHDRTIASLYIGRGWSRIDIFSDGNLVMTRGIKAGINSMVESLVDEYPAWRQSVDRESSHADVPESGDAVLELSGNGPVEEAPNLDQARQLIELLSPDSKPETELAEQFGLTGEAIFTLIKPALERLVRQVERTFEHYVVNMGREAISAIYLSTAMNVCPPMSDYMAGQLDMSCDILDPLDPSHPWVEEVTAEETVSERSAYVPVLGVALSHQSRTLNLIYTQEDQKQRKKYMLANYVALAVIGVLLLSGLGWYAWCDRVVAGKQDRVARLEQQVQKGIEITEESVRNMVGDLKLERERAREMRDRYLSAAVFGEVSSVTPEKIKLMNIRAALDDMPAGEKGGSSRAPQRNMLIDGFVTGVSDTLDADLIDYVMNIQSSPLFERVVINAKVPETIEGREVLRFTLTASMEVPST
ncbi:MAG: hypothetical protein AVO39_01760 [delta proteobacterium MLS_D]|nr:MAG: hypothetical protein AVO39_01760 [delta proteobacterium MLS_D]